MRFADEDFYVDLVFYNYLLRCFVLVDLKVGKLTHQDIGQMDSYVRVFDAHARPEGDNPTIGLILCSSKNEAIAKYSVLSEARRRGPALMAAARRGKNTTGAAAVAPAPTTGLPRCVTLWPSPSRRSRQAAFTARRATSAPPPSTPAMSAPRRPTDRSEETTCRRRSC